MLDEIAKEQGDRLQTFSSLRFALCSCKKSLYAAIDLSRRVRLVRTICYACIPNSSAVRLASIIVPRDQNLELAERFGRELDTLGGRAGSLLQGLGQLSLEVCHGGLILPLLLLHGASQV